MLVIKYTKIYLKIFDIECDVMAFELELAQLPIPKEKFGKRPELKTIFKDRNGNPLPVPVQHWGIYHEFLQWYKCERCLHEYPKDASYWDYH